MTRPSIHDKSSPVPDYDLNDSKNHSNNLDFNSIFMEDINDGKKEIAIELRDWWQRLSTVSRLFLGTSLLIFGLIVFVEITNSFLASPYSPSNSPPAGSSSSNTSSGLLAYKSLLSSSGLNVSSTNSPIGLTNLDSAGTVIVADETSFNKNDLQQLLLFAKKGNTVILMGSSAITLTPKLIRSNSIQSNTIDRSQISYVNYVRPYNAHSTKNSHGSYLVYFGSNSGYFVGENIAPLLTLSGYNGTPRIACLRISIGNGTVIVLPSSSPLSNSEISQADNAGFGLSLIHDATKQIVFANGNYTPITVAPGTLPTRIHNLIYLLLFAAFIFIWSIFLRLGKASRRLETLHPKRSAYLDAMATTISKSKNQDNVVAEMRIILQTLIEKRRPNNIFVGDPQTTNGNFPDWVVEAAYSSNNSKDEILKVSRALSQVLRGTYTV